MSNLTERARPIFVGERLFRVWPAPAFEDPELILKGLDPHYFEWMANSIEENAQRDGAWPLHLTARVIHAQASETFFSLLFSMFQAPYDTAAWLLLYNSRDLNLLLSKFEQGGEFPRRVRLEESGWEGLGKFMFPLRRGDGGISAPDEHVSKIVAVWKQVSVEFRDPVAREEYNAIKHGFRARAGPAQAFAGSQRLLDTEHGTSFPIRDIRGQEVVLRLGTRAWTVSNLCACSRVLACSISNIRDLIWGLNGRRSADYDSVLVPSAHDLAAAAPKPGMGSLTLGPRIPENFRVPMLDRRKVLEWYKASEATLRREPPAPE